MLILTAMFIEESMIIAVIFFGKTYSVDKMCW